MSDPTAPRRAWRLLMWLLVVLSAIFLALAGVAGRDGDGGALIRQVVLATGCLALAGWLGVRSARAEARVEAARAAAAARMLLVATLGQHDDATLQRIAASPGPAAEAARQLLQGRHLGNPAGQSRHTNSES